MPSASEGGGVTQWFVPARYEELRSFSHRQWASLLQSRLCIQHLISDRENSADEELRVLDEAAVASHFEQLSNIERGLLGDEGAANVRVPSIFVSASSVQNMTLGDMLLQKHLLGQDPAAGSAMFALESVLNCGYVVNGNWPDSENPYLNSEEIDALSKVVNPSLVRVDLRLSRKDLIAAFGRWLDVVKPGERAAADKVRPNTDRWFEDAVVPLVDLVQWMRWKKVDFTATEMTELLRPFISNKIRDHGRTTFNAAAFDAKKLIRTNLGMADRWLTEETLIKLLGLADSEMKSETEQSLPPNLLTRMLWAHAQRQRRGKN